MTSSVIITVVVVLGIVIAGGFLIYFMGDLFMSLAHKGKDEEAIRISQEKRTRALESRVNALENSDRAKNDPAIATVLYNGAMVEDYNPEPVVEEEQPEEAQEEIPAETEEEPAPQEDDTSDYIKQRRQELMERLMKMRQMEEETEETEENSDIETVDVTDEQVEEETEKQPQESEEAQEETVETEEQTEESEETEEAEEPATETEETIEDEEEIEETTENTEEETEEQPLDETQDDTVDTTVAIIPDSNSEEATIDAPFANIMSLEELEARLAEEHDKLKANEKELRQTKKEYIPLRRVKKTLENDEKKLRRKEALVAKQKVVLYGVNNYADIDEEKAKKLSEDLDLLDGLKLSVQHCEEVMSKNAERYPLLEKIYNLLSSQNAEIKANIKNLQEAIEKIKNESNGEGDAE